MKNFKLILAVAGLALMLIFVLQNMEVVEVDFLLWSLRASRVLIFLSVFLIGVGVGWLGKSLRWL